MPMQRIFRWGSPLLLLAVVATGCESMSMARGDAMSDAPRTGRFEGAKADMGHATFSKSGGRLVLTLSDDFKVPDTPAPHWQVVDSKGNVYLLQRLVIKEQKYNRSITLPAYIRDVAKVQIWCAWAETLLGEASFPEAVR